MAYAFGTSPEIAAFFVSYRLANVFRRLFAEGALINGFIPHYQQLASSDEKQAKLFCRDLSFTMSVFLFLFVLMVVGAISLISSIVPSHFLQIVRLTQIMFPSIIFLCLYGIFSSYLQCQNQFFISGVVPVIFNIVWTVSAIFLSSFPESSAVVYLSYSILLGFFLQWLITFLFSLPTLKEISFSEWVHPVAFSKDVKKVIKALLATIIGVGAMQINSGLDAIFARMASLEGPAFLTYAIRVQQLPLALFAISLSTAFFPEISKRIKESPLIEIQKMIRSMHSKLMTLMIFCLFGIFSLGFFGLGILYLRGNFDLLSLTQTLKCLWVYALALPFVASVIFYSQIFYANKNYKYPMKGAVLSVIMNIAMNYFFVNVLKLGFVSVAFATTLSSALNASFLFFKLKQDQYVVQTISKSMKLITVGFCASALQSVISHLLFKDLTYRLLTSNWSPFPSFYSLFFGFIFSSSLYVMFFYFFARIAALEEALIIRNWAFSLFEKTRRA